jgi:hypothetical protein
MTEATPPPEAVQRAGFETRDVDVTVIVVIGVGLVLVGGVILWFLWELTGTAVPETRSNGASPPVTMPGQPPVGERLDQLPPPRVEGLVAQPDVHPEDLRADRQPGLQGYGWVDERKGVARIPIDRAMEAVVESSRPQSPQKKGGRP